MPSSTATQDDSSFAAADATDPQLQDRTIGEIFRQEQGLTSSQLAEIKLYQAEHGVRFGEAAVALGLVQRDDVVRALSQQFQYPYSPAQSHGPINDELVMANAPFSDEVECFRDLRTQLLMGVLSPTHGRRALAVVSPEVGDGKTFILSNLAVAFSQLRGRTLLVDGDMRNPRLHKVFNIDNTHGLSSILSGRIQGGDINVIRPVAELPNLYMLPVGAVPPNPLELVHQAGFDLLIQELLTKFDTVLVDTPAAVHGSDCRIIASKCGAALIISRKDKTHTERLQALVSQLSKGPTMLAGVMFNSF